MWNYLLLYDTSVSKDKETAKVAPRACTWYGTIVSVDGRYLYKHKYEGRTHFCYPRFLKTVFMGKPDPKPTSGLESHFGEKRQRYVNDVVPTRAGSD